MKKFTSVLGLLLVTMLVMPTATNAETASEKLQNAVTDFRTRVSARVDSLEELKNSGASNVEIRLVTADEVLTQADADLLALQADITYVLFFNAQEKRVLKTLFHAIDSKVRVYLENVEDIAADLEAGTITEEEAADELNTQVNAVVDYLKEHKNDFREKIHQTMKLKVQAAVVYTKFGYDFAKVAEASYDTMGYNTKRVELLLSTGEDLYDDAKALYDEAKDGGSDADMSTLRQSAVKLIKSRRNLSKAQIRLKAMETEWTESRSAE